MMLKTWLGDSRLLPIEQRPCLLCAASWHNTDVTGKHLLTAVCTCAIPMPFTVIYLQQIFVLETLPPISTRTHTPSAKPALIIIVVIVFLFFFSASEKPSSALCRCPSTTAALSCLQIKYPRL
jgi:hypothetical protein